VLCNDSRLSDGRLSGDPTEGALLALAAKGGTTCDERERFPRIAEVPFDSNARYMATFHAEQDHVLMVVKGAPEILLGMSSHVRMEGGAVPLADDALGAVATENALLADRGLRVLAIATRTLGRPEFDGSPDCGGHANGLTLVGFVGLEDPPRAAAKEAVRTCRGAGIDVKMITGDQPTTARVVARELGLTGAVVTGPALDGMDENALATAFASTSVFARTTPHHKLRLVRAARAMGLVVAVTGDGVNDAPALKCADIGVAMGSGTEVAKQAAAIVLTDDNFSTIVGAVLEGRAIYENVLKFVRFQLSTNFGALFTVFAAPFLGFATPLSTPQILWVAMIMDGPPAIALGLDPAHPSLLSEGPRRSGARILPARRLALLGVHACIMALGTLSVFAAALPGGYRHATTLAFTTFVWFQLFSVFNARSERHTAFATYSLGNWRLWVALAAVVALQVTAVHVPLLQGVLGTSALSRRDWLLAIGVGSSILFVEEARKVLVRLRAHGHGMGSPARSSGSRPTDGGL
jgi:Ca2+-transporting ATPase